jgi:hypothetical protein
MSEAHPIDRYGGNGDHLEIAGRSFVSGHRAQSRMDHVRKYIEDVRRNWVNIVKAGTLPSDVNRFLEHAVYKEWGAEAVDKVQSVLAKSFSMSPDWADRKRTKRRLTHADFHLIKFYTEDDGYKFLFQVVNHAFRDIENDNHPNLWASTFIIELLNMELYEYTARFPDESEDHEGRLYRGYRLPRARLSEFESAADASIAREREISIPLGLHSSSTNIDVARKFISEAEYSNLNQDQQIGIILDIRVASLTSDLEKKFKDRFPENVISKICATNVQRLSAFDKESEVLLRGPFFDCIDFVETDPVNNIPTWLCKVVMVDANRDHISTYELGTKDGEARTLFRSIVGVQKYEAAIANSWTPRDCIVVRE